MVISSYSISSQNKANKTKIKPFLGAKNHMWRLFNNVSISRSTLVSCSVFHGCISSLPICFWIWTCAFLGGIYSRTWSCTPCFPGYIAGRFSSGDTSQKLEGERQGDAEFLPFPGSCGFPWRDCCISVTPAFATPAHALYGHHKSLGCYISPGVVELPHTRNNSKWKKKNK